MAKYPNITAKEAGKLGAEKAMRVTTPEQRTKSARNAANARWAKQRQEKLSLETTSAA